MVMLLFSGSYWDDNSVNNGSSSTSNSVSGVSDAGHDDGVVAIPSTSHHHLLIVALIEHLCSLYVPDTDKGSQLFKSKH